MRPSSVTVEPSSGTFRSLLTRTYRPRTPSAISSLRVWNVMCLTLAQLGCDKLREVHEAVGVAPFVVIPGNNLDLVADDLGQAGVEDRRGRVADDVGGDDRLVRVGQDALEFVGLGGLP